MSGVESSLSGDVSDSYAQHQSQREIVDGRHHALSVVSTQVAPVLSQRLVSTIVQSVFDLPMGSHYLQQLSRAGAALVQACYPIAELPGYPAVSETFDSPVQLEDLTRVWPVQIVIEIRTGSEYAPFESSMSFVYGLRSGDCGTETVGMRTSILKQCGYIIAQLWLVVFDIPHILTTRRQLSAPTVDVV